MNCSVVPERAGHEDHVPPLLPGLIGGVVARGAAMVRAIQVRWLVVIPRVDADPTAPAPLVHEVVVGGRIRLRSPTALIHWRRRPAAPALSVEGKTDSGARIAPVALVRAKA
jgi:hypothetical protein